MIGQTSSHYRGVETLGAGGMGEVYLARSEDGPRGGDQSLGRTVQQSVRARGARRSKRCLALMPPEDTVPLVTQNQVIVALNFFDEVRRRVAGQIK
jgi:hypothetical protein